MTVFNPKSTGKVTLNVTRTSSDGSYVKGKYVDGTTSVIPIEANYQPANEEILLALPEAERSRDPHVVYTPFSLRTVNKDTGTPADQVEINSVQYKVHKVARYEMGVLDHTKAIVLRVQ